LAAGALVLLTAVGLAVWFWPPSSGPSAPEVLPPSKPKPPPVVVVKPVSWTWRPGPTGTVKPLKGSAKPPEVKAVALSPDGTWLAVAYGKQVQVWDVKPNEVSFRATWFTAFAANCVAVSGDGKLLAGGGAISNPSLPSVTVWDVERGEEVASLPAHESGVVSLAFSPSGLLITGAGGGKETRIGIWELPSAKSLGYLTKHTAGVRTLAFSRDGVLVSGSTDRSVRRWDVAGRQEVPPLRRWGDDEADAKRGPVVSVAVSPDGKRVAAGFGRVTDVHLGIKLWDGTTADSIPGWLAHDMPVHRLAFTPDGRALLAAHGDKSVRVYGMASLKE